LKIKRISNFIVLSIILTIVCVNVSNGQTKPDSVKIDSCCSATGAIIRSLIVPGWGQIYQERLFNGLTLYSTAAIFYYRAFYNLNRYHITGSQNRLDKFRTNISVAAFIHLINLIDVTDAAYDDSPKGWKGSLLSDLPPKSPWGATLRSAILPGWGQLYNESYWKAAGFLIADGYLIYRIRNADLKYRDSKSQSDRDERSTYSWYFGLAYFLTMADAYAGAYLYKFDEAMQLTFKPQIMEDGVGVNCCVRF
jgi:hypothetical protein